MAKQKPQRPQLSKLEQQIMQVVWHLDECTSNDVIDEFTKHRPLAKSTIRTVLASLHKKGYVERIPTIERGFRLKPTVSRDAVASRTLKDLVAGLFAGSPTQAISTLLKDEAIDETELEEIRLMLDERKRARENKE